LPNLKSIIGSHKLWLPIDFLNCLMAGTDLGHLTSKAGESLANLWRIREFIVNVWL